MLTSPALYHIQNRTLLSGIFFLLTVQATVALVQKPRYPSQVAHNRWILLSYVWITFILATVGFAGNALYTQMIWIDLRNTPGGPTALILNELNYWINIMALTWYALCMYAGY